MPLGVSATEDNLHDVFKQYGLLRSVAINPQTNVAFIVFEDEAGAERAYQKCHNMEVQGHHLFVDYAAGRQQQG